MPQVEFVEQDQFHQEPIPPEVLKHRQQPHGQSSDALALSRETAIQAEEMAGIVPFTVINFNPVPVSVISQGDSITIPPCSLGKEKKVKWGSIERKGSILVLRQLGGYQRPMAVTTTPDAQNPDVQREWKVVRPIENARKFEFEYNQRAPSMGGLLVFQGDGHAVGVGHSNDQIIQVPNATRARNRSLLYHTTAESLIEKMDAIFTRQKEYCFMRMAEAQALADDPEPEIRKSVFNGPAGYAAWGQFAIDLGWKDRSELTWMLTKDARESCVKCGAGKTSGTAMFCKCGHPYDPFGAFMAGMPVDRDILSALPVEQLEIVKGEMRRRARLFSDLEGEDEKKAKK